MKSIQKLVEHDQKESDEELEDLDEEQVLNIFQESGLMKKDKVEKKDDIKMFENVECHSAFYVFDKQNWFRKFCYKSIKK